MRSRLTSRLASLTLALVSVGAAARSGQATRALGACIVPLLFIWFADTLGERVSGRIGKPSPPLVIWFSGWVLLLALAAAAGIDWLRAN